MHQILDLIFAKNLFKKDKEITISNIGKKSLLSINNNFEHFFHNANGTKYKCDYLELLVS